MKRRINWRSLLARLPLPMLALAASYGVYSFATLFVPPLVAGIQAAAFELTYIGLAVTQSLDGAERRRATAISIGAVVASIVYNTLAGWFHRQPELLASGDAIAWLMFAILHGAPLAWVAYLVADLLLHSKRRSSRPRQLRALVRRLARLLRQARASGSSDSAILAVARSELETARAELRTQGEEFAQLLLDSEQARERLARSEPAAARLGQALEEARDQLRTTQDEARKSAHEVAQLRANLDTARAEQTQSQHAAAQHHAEFLRVSREQEADRREYEQVGAQLREELALARASAVLDVLAVARRLVASGVPLREIAPLVGVPESTLRGRLKSATNGHAVESS